MLYYYANTGHKLGLERLRRGVALLNRLSLKGIETQLLVNDFRAGLIARELGVTSYVTIETIQDIDAIAEAGNSIVIDSAEDNYGRLIKYCTDFKQVWRFAHDEKEGALYHEMVIERSTVFIDDQYFEEKPKEERLLFFLGDADYDKIILSHAGFFKEFDMELLLGNYFFVKYEDDLEKLFLTLHEPEAYRRLITTSSTVVTASSQTALEAKAGGARVIYLNINKDTIVDEALLSTYGITILSSFDKENFSEILQKDVLKTGKKIEKIDDKIFLS